MCLLVFRPPLTCASHTSPLRSTAVQRLHAVTGEGTHTHTEQETTEKGEGEQQEKNAPHASRVTHSNAARQRTINSHSETTQNRAT